MGLFTYDENKAELERLEARRREIEWAALAPETEEAREFDRLEVEIAKMRKWVNATSRIEGHELRS